MTVLSALELAAAAILPVALYVATDGGSGTPDGARYTSGRPQPSPFNRRFTGWPPWLLAWTTVGSLSLSGALMGDWQRALLLLTAPGAWFLATHPTTVDAPSMALALLSAKAHATGLDWLALPLAALAGAVHERGVVFAAVYGWSLLPLLALPVLVLFWWRRPAPDDGDPLVGIPSLREVLRRHRPHSDLLDWKVAPWALRGIGPLAVYYGCEPRGWAAFGLAFASRAVSTDPSRCLLWAAPAMILGTPEPAAWMVWLHVASFRRMS